MELDSDEDIVELTPPQRLQQLWRESSMEMGSDSDEEDIVELTSAMSRPIVPELGMTEQELDQAFYDIERSFMEDATETMQSSEETSHRLIPEQPQGPESLSAWGWEPVP